MGKTLCLIGAGTSLLEVPPTHTFTNDTMALNVSTIAPQFFDFTSETFHHSWTYGMFIDHKISNGFYFPERLYFTKSLGNMQGTLFVTEQMLTGKQRDLPNIKYVTIDKKRKLVLAPALIKAKELGYAHVILIGCDFCIYDERRYWWEYHEYEDGILTHPNNNGAVKASSMNLAREAPLKQRPKPDSVRMIATDKMVMTYVDRKGSEATYVHVEDTRGGRAIMSELLYKQFNKIKCVVNELEDDTFKISKYTGMGMLDVPVVDNLNQL